MPGRFKKAPLIYVTARIRTTPLPQLSSDQTAIVQQAMMKCGLVVSETSQSQVLDITQVATISSSDQKIETSQLTTSVQRHGFFNVGRTECLILAHDTIEWRASTYSKYGTFAHSFEKAIQALLNAVDVFGCLVTQEFILSYADVIAPKQGRSLNEYFKASDKILPLSFLDKDTNDVQQVGLVQITRVTAPKEKISVSLEQLPVKERKIQKYLPEALRELDNNFSMPLHPQKEWSDLDSNDYGLLMTQAGLLKNTTLKELEFSSTFKRLHNLTSDTFRLLINRPVCNEDWEYENSEGVH